MATMMVTLSATKKVEIRHITAVLTLRLLELRPDIRWLLRSLNEKFSPGERENLQRYLESLGLMSGTMVTPSGETALNTGRVLMPESGVYELYYIRDFALGNLVVHFDRADAWARVGEGSDTLEEFAALEGGPFTSWKRGGDRTPFSLEFEHRLGDAPRVIRQADIPAQAELICDSSSGARWKVTAQDFVGEFKCQNFSLDQNVGILVDGWDSSLSAQLVSFDDVRADSMAFRQFRRIIKTAGVRRLRFTDGPDPIDYSVEVRDVEVIPRSTADAKHWLELLLKEDLIDEKAYCTAFHIEEKERALLARTPLGKRHKDLFITMDAFVKMLKEEHPAPTEPDSADLYYRVQAAEDLWPGGLEDASADKPVRSRGGSR